MPRADTIIELRASFRRRNKFDRELRHDIDCACACGCNVRIRRGGWRGRWSIEDMRGALTLRLVARELRRR